MQAMQVLALSGQCFKRSSSLVHNLMFVLDVDRFERKLIKLKCLGEQDVLLVMIFLVIIILD